MKIYTKRGDNGKTDLFGGERVFKDHIRVKAYGEIDSVNTALGFAYSHHDMPKDIKPILLTTMKLIFCAGSEVATSEKKTAGEILARYLKTSINKAHIQWLEKKIDEITFKLPELKNFILPCGSESSTRLHLARDAIRRAEISLVSLSHEENVREEIIIFFNRLSDLLFVLSRYANKLEKIKELEWSGQADLVEC